MEEVGVEPSGVVKARCAPETGDEDVSYAMSLGDIEQERCSWKTNQVWFAPMSGGELPYEFRFVGWNLFDALCVEIQVLHHHGGGQAPEPVVKGDILERLGGE